jgi:hypothetical protein
MVLSDTSKIDISQSHDITAFVEGIDPSHLSTQFRRTNPSGSLRAKPSAKITFSVNQFNGAVLILWNEIQN